MKSIFLILSIIGISIVLYTIGGIYLDITSFDQTQGGYEYPYEDWTGSPVNWDNMLISDTGLVKEGYIVDVLVNGTTGMISFRVLGMIYDWRTFSDRSLKVHKPKEALIRLGFKPVFDQVTG